MFRDSNPGPRGEDADGGGGWESNPPRVPCAARVLGFEDQGGHQTPFTSRPASLDHKQVLGQPCLRL